MGENTKYFSTKMYRVTKHTICGLSLFHSQMLRLLKFRVSHFLARSDSSCAQLLSASSHITGRFAKLLFTKRLKQPLLAVNSNLHPVLAHSLMTIEVKTLPTLFFLTNPGHHVFLHLHKNVLAKFQQFDVIGHTLSCCFVPFFVF